LGQVTATSKQEEENQMTREELAQLIGEVQQGQSELAPVEVKSARVGTPERLYEPLSAFANRPGGGVIVFGLDEEGNPGPLREHL
jgi:ATP-dependent DNA helicase RecG